MITTLPDTPKEQSGQEQQPYTLEIGDRPESENDGRQPVPEQLYEEAEYQHERKDNGYPPHHMFDAPFLTPRCGILFFEHGLLLLNKQQKLSS